MEIIPIKSDWWTLATATHTIFCLLFQVFHHSFDTKMMMEMNIVHRLVWNHPNCVFRGICLTIISQPNSQQLKLTEKSVNFIWKITYARTYAHCLVFDRSTETYIPYAATSQFKVYTQSLWYYSICLATHDDQLNWSTSNVCEAKLAHILCRAWMGPRETLLFYTVGAYSN